MCVSPLLFTLLIHDCTITYCTNHMGGLHIKDEEPHCRKKVGLLTTWCRDKNILLNISKSREIVVEV